MKIITLLFATLLLMGNARGQEISINASANIQAPADKISFQINLNAEADTPQKAYKLHKEREKVLVDLLKKHTIEEKNINFEPVSISRIYNSNRSDGREKQVQTQQTVILSLKDFSKYEDIQITLIENDFDEFSGHFMSSKAEEAEDEALKKALALARSKAEIIADQTDLNIQSIKNINYSYNNHPPQPMREMSMMKSSDSSLMEFDQTVTVSAHVSVTYNLDSKES